MSESGSYSGIVLLNVPRLFIRTIIYKHTLSYLCPYTIILSASKQKEKIIIHIKYFISCIFHYVNKSTAHVHIFEKFSVLLTGLLQIQFVSTALRIPIQQYCEIDRDAYDTRLLPQFVDLSTSLSSSIHIMWIQLPESPVMNHIIPIIPGECKIGK